MGSTKATVQNFVLFIGYQRSGHSLVGSLLDAHPQVVMSHELGILQAFAEDEPLDQIYDKIIQNSAEFTEKGRSWTGYTYAVPNQWQGRFEKIISIGDKSGGMSTRALAKTNGLALLQKVKDHTRVPLKLLHLVRNPFDNITTMTMRTHQRNGKAMDLDLLELKIGHYFTMVKQNAQLKQSGRFDILDVHLEEFIDQPTQKLREMCTFIGVEAQADYLRDTTGIVWKKPSLTRHKLEHLWTKDMIETVQNQMNQYDFLTDYRYDQPETQIIHEDPKTT